jgi:hypothetical protein
VKVFRGREGDSFRIAADEDPQYSQETYEVGEDALIASAKALDIVKRSTALSLFPTRTRGFGGNEELS